MVIPAASGPPPRSPESADYGAGLQNEKYVFYRDGTKILRIEISEPSVVNIHTRMRAQFENIENYDIS